MCENRIWVEWACAHRQDSILRRGWLPKGAQRVTVEFRKERGAKLTCLPQVQRIFLPDQL